MLLSYEIHFQSLYVSVNLMVLMFIKILRYQCISHSNSSRQKIQKLFQIQVPIDTIYLKSSLIQRWYRSILIDIGNCTDSVH